MAHREKRPNDPGQAKPAEGNLRGILPRHHEVATPTQYQSAMQDFIRFGPPELRASLLGGTLGQYLDQRQSGCADELAAERLRLQLLRQASRNFFQTVLRDALNEGRPLGGVLQSLSGLNSSEQRALSDTTISFLRRFSGLRLHSTPESGAAQLLQQIEGALHKS